jgi:two-component system KDP operon response regulator KdpE
VSRATTHPVLVVDDEPQVVRAIRAILESRGFEVLAATSGAEALECLLTRTPHLIVLDLTLPDEDGLVVLGRIREFLEVPILVLSARTDEQDKVEALNGGADDYVTKPFSASEFVARVGVLLRRSDGAPGTPTMVEVGDLRVDFAHRRVERSGKAVALTPIEYEILVALAQNPDRVLTWGQLIQRAWGGESEADVASLRVHVSNLRRKIEPHPGVPRYILTEPRVGFRFSTR